jgi:hypothetical protein
VGILIHYCLFHYDQSINRAVKKLRLRHLRGEDEFDDLMRGLRAVPFLPPDEVRQGSVELFWRFNAFFRAQNRVTQAKLQRECFLYCFVSASNRHLTRSGLANYYRDNYVGKVVMRRGEPIVQDPRFVVTEWNCWDATLEGRARTNNFNEGKNRAHKRKHYRGASPKLSLSIRIDRAEENKVRNRYLM